MLEINTEWCENASADDNKPVYNLKFFHNNKVSYFLLSTVRSIHRTFFTEFMGQNKFHGVEVN